MNILYIYSKHTCQVYKRGNHGFSVHSNNKYYQSLVNMDCFADEKIYYKCFQYIYTNEKPNYGFLFIAMTVTVTKETMANGFTFVAKHVTLYVRMGK